MKVRISAVVLALAMVMGSGNLQAEVRSWELDTAHSNFYFSVDHIYSKVRGAFPEYSGEVRFDPDNLKESSFSFTIKVSSVDTGIAKRDKHLLSEDFFDAAAHPEMTFVSTGITAEADNVYRVAGTFTVKGKPYDLELPLTLAGIREHPMDKAKDVAGFNGRISIDRLAVGVGSGKFYDLGVVGKDVEIFVSLEVLSQR